MYPLQAPPARRAAAGIALGGTTNEIDTQPGPLFKATREDAFALTWEQEN
jgi:hypothetical protein